VVKIHHIPYIYNANGHWLCLLCNATSIPMQRVLRHHHHGSRHPDACKELAKARSVFKTRIKKLAGQRRWQQIVEEVARPPGEKTARTPVSQNTSVLDLQAHDFKFVRTLVERYEQMERLSLLELAIWKANCINHGLAFSTMQEIDDYGALESGFDPLVYIQQKRITSGAAVIIENVLPFLQG
jgi:hypothetical protein